MASGLPQVHGEHVVRTEHHLSDIARSQQFDAVVDLGRGDLRVGAPDRPSHGAGFAANAGWLNVATGDFSDSPYAS